jgi:hypothetical protein
VLPKRRPAQPNSLNKGRLKSARLKQKERAQAMRLPLRGAARKAFQSKS